MKGLYDVGWSDEKKCRGCEREEDTETQAIPLFIQEGG